MERINLDWYSPEELEQNILSVVNKINEIVDWINDGLL